MTFFTILSYTFDKIDLMQVIFCLFLKEDVTLYRERLPLIFPSQRSEPDGGEEGAGGNSNSNEEKMKEDEDSAKL